MPGLDSSPRRHAVHGDLQKPNEKSHGIVQTHPGITATAGQFKRRQRPTPEPLGLLQPIVGRIMQFGSPSRPLIYQKMAT